MKYNLWELDEFSRVMISSKSTHFNLYYNTTSKLLNIYLQMPDDVKKYRNEMLCILTNTARAIKFNASYLGVLRNWSFYSNTAQKISFSKMIKLQDILEGLGYIDIYRGGIIDWPSMETECSYVALKDTLTVLFKDVKVEELLTSKELITCTPVIVRDRETKEVLSTRGMKGVAEIKEDVQKFNLALIDSNFNLSGVDISSPQFFRSYNDTLDLGGRYYEQGTKIQTKPRVKRNTLMIDNEETVTLDFKAMHASLLYEVEYKLNPLYIDNWINIEWNGKYDPYPSELNFLVINYDKIEFIRKNFDPKYNPIRNLTKHATMIALNASSKESAQKSVIQAYKNEYNAVLEDPDFDMSRVKYYGIEFNGKFQGSKVMEVILKHNAPISKYFYSDIGIRLQNTDSNIMAKVIDNIVSLDCDVIIPEHDGCIVKASLKDKCIEYMKEAYREVMQSDKFCIIEEK